MTSSAEYVRYIDKSRNYYEAHGYDKPYRWAHFEQTPFVTPSKRLSESRVSLVTTAMPNDSYRGQQRRLAFGDLKNPPASLYTGDLAWDRQATHTDDRETYLPIQQLEAAVGDGRLGSMSKRFYSVPTLYSARHTIESDAPAIVSDCIEDAVDIVLLVPL